jgi:hypothetical protein
LYGADIKNYSDLPLYDKCRAVFDNFRIRNSVPVGLKLTKFGNRLLKKHFQCYSYDTPISLTGKVLLSLDAAMTWPYYVDDTKIVFYSELDAGQFKLGGSDLGYFTEVI